MQLDQTDPVVQRVKQNLTDVLGDGLQQTSYVLAVSGGGDSIAMLHALAAFLPTARLTVVSVNHNLRAEAADELALVERICSDYGLVWRCEDWTWDGTGNLQAAAREGRWAALKSVVQDQGDSCVLVGHTEDDQIETFLLRLARGSGVDGLAAMPMRSVRDGVPVIRPLLTLGRDELRSWLSGHGLDWADDPSNQDSRFARVQARQMMAQLDTLGLTRKRILQTVQHMQSAAQSLNTAVRQFVETRCWTECGDVIIPLTNDVLDDQELLPRTVAKAIQWVGGETFKPRYQSLMTAISDALEGKQRTLSGCVLYRKNNDLRIGREVSAVEGFKPIEGVSSFGWDGRWRLSTVSGGAADRVRALKEDGLAQCPNWRDCGIPRDTLLTTPSLWADDTLIAAPIAGYGSGWTARIDAEFADWLVTH